MRAFRENRGRFAVGLLVLVASGLLFNAGGDVESRVNRSQFNLYLGGVLLQRGETGRAIERMEKALALEPGNMGRMIRWGRRI